MTPAMAAPCYGTDHTCDRGLDMIVDGADGMIEVIEQSLFGKPAQ